MKRTITDVIRRGFDSTLANWQVVLIRVAESFVVGLLMVLSIIAIAVPIVVSAGISKWSPPSGATPSDAAIAFLVDHAMLIVYLIAILFVVFGIAVAVHAFVAAGAARIFVDAERKSPDPAAPRETLAAFSGERFFDEAKNAWWRVFWIYNATWSVGALIVLIPILITGIGLIPAIANESAPAIFAVGCGGIALILLVGVPVAFVISIWTQKAIIVCVAANTAVRDALRTSWRAIRADFLRHIVVGVIIMVISIGAGALISGMLAPLTLMGHHGDPFSMMFAPPRMILSVLQSAIGNAVACWFIAAFAAMTEEK